MNSEIRIYIADLAAYNAGHIHGIWVDATEDLSTIEEQITKMLENSPVQGAEEYQIHSYEGFKGYELEQYESVKTAHHIACFLQDQGDIASYLLSHFNGDIEEAEAAIEDNYSGCYSSVADFAQDLTEDTSEIPKHLEFYIDYELMGRDMELSGDIFTIESAHDTVHVFWNH